MNNKRIHNHVSFYYFRDSAKSYIITKKKNQKAEGKFVTFKQGDSLIGLCAKEYKNSGYAPMIASINNLISFRDIKPGTQLWFPKI